MARSITELTPGISPPTLCIFSPWNYPLFNTNVQTSFGGWEVRIALIARELAKRGRFKVKMIVADHGQPHVEEIEGITFYSWPGRSFWGIPFPPQSAGNDQWIHSCFRYLRSMRHWIEARLLPARKCSSSNTGPLQTDTIGSHRIELGAISLFDEVDADIYMVPGNSQLSAELAFFCRQRGRKYAFLAGSDMDYYPEYKESPEKLDIYQVPYELKVYAIESADIHIVQNERQVQMLQKGYNRSSVLIRNPIDLSPGYPSNLTSNTLLWVGKSDERVKCPSVVLNLARKLPEYSFVMIMTFAIPEVHKHCLEEAEKFPNLKIVERVPFHEVEKFFAGAKLFLNTSLFEGFPNTFLQAAKYGLPIVSWRVDPDEMLSMRGCGVCCNGDLDVMVESIRLLMKNPKKYREKSLSLLAYIQAYHDKDKVIPLYQDALLNVLCRRTDDERSAAKSACSSISRGRNPGR